MFMKHYVPTDVNQALNFGGGGVRADVNGEVKFFLFVFFLGGGGGRVGGGGGGKGKCEQRSEVF